MPLALGRGEGWPAWTWLCLTAGAATVAAFPAVERRIAAHGGAPLVAVAVLAGPTVGWALITLTTATGTYYALLFTLAQYLQQGLGRSPLVSGLTLLPWVAAFGLAGAFPGADEDVERLERLAGAGRRLGIGAGE